MHTLQFGKRKTTSSHEDVAVHNADERENHSEIWETDTNLTTKNTNSNYYRDMSSIYHGTWPLDRNIWEAESPALLRMETASVMSFASSSGGVPLDQLLTTPDQSRRSSQQLETKVDMVYNLLAMLGGQEHAEMGETLLALSISPESCLAMRQSGCLPLLVQLVQSDRDAEMRKKAARALHNLVESQPDEKARKREIKILRLLEIVTSYTESLENGTEFICDNSLQDGNQHPIQVISQIMKSSFDEGYRQAICQLGGIHSIAKLIEMEHFAHGSVTEDSCCNQLRKYACMVLTNLTFGDSGNKALLCSYKDFIKTLLLQLQSPNDEVRQVTAGVLRNLSWRADSTSKEILKEIGSVKSLMQAAMLDNKENTLISILSALWNLSAHCKENKSEICSIDGALIFLIKTLSYRSSSETLAVIENCGGILRNISSQIAGREDYRMILRNHNCFQILVNHLKSTSSTIVSNACGTLWNLSSQNATDQELLWKLGAPSLLKNLNKSKHKTIAMGSSAILKNLLAAKAGQVFPQIDFSKSFDSRTQINLNEVTDADLPLDLSRKRPEMEIIENSRNTKSISSKSSNINEAASFMNDKGPSSSTSLPYVNSTKSRSSLTCIPVRSKYGDNYEDGLESSEEPFDFSRKYSETKQRENAQKEKCSSVASYNYEKPKNENEKFSIYAETDLDQPTDYSLRYAENDSDSDSEEGVSTEKTRAEFVGDTVKTYCTEGTPYETPFNFSTSTSMSDLRITDKNNSDNDKTGANECNTKEVLVDEVLCVPVQDSVAESQPQTSKMKSELSSGLMSPEKPMNYCDEGTPGYFSRVSSFGSLNSSPVCQSETKAPEEMDKENNEVVAPKVDKIQPKVSNSEVKVVKFESNVNYCEETPLMFSRSSSLGSLDSIEQHSIHDDRSSVISDFSRLTSGIISPSELPDSPTQTIPPSPKPQKTPEFPINHRTSTESKSHMLSNKLPSKSHIFEDNVTKFKEESTPIQYSMATSLSSLTIDDQDDGQIQGLIEDEDSGRKKDSDNPNPNEVNTSLEQSNLPQFYSNFSRANIPGKQRRQIDLLAPSTRKQPSNFQNTSNSPKVLPPPLPVENSVQMYCTEDTPAVLSHNGSISDLSISTLSMLDEEPVQNEVYLSENSSQSSEMHENTRRSQSVARPTKVEVNEQCDKEEHDEESPSKAQEDGIATPTYITARDEVCLFAVENSPAQFSAMSSLSNLTIGSSAMSDINSFSLPKNNIPEEGSSNCCAEILLNEENEKHTSNVEFAVESTLAKACTEHNSEYATPIEGIIAVEERGSVDTLLSPNNQHSTIEENSIQQCEHSPILQPKCLNLESQGGPNCSDSLKKRKWKWKWKFGSDTYEQGDLKEKTSPIEYPTIQKHLPGTVPKNEEVKEENALNMLGTKSLDARKKKWWKWKFGAKETDQCETPAVDLNKCGYLDVVPQNKQFPEVDTDVCSNKESTNTASFSAKEDMLFLKSDTRSKSKRWKWKWKFSSKEGESPKSDEFLSLGLSKLKHSVSPVRKREHYSNEDQMELPSLGNNRESRSISVKVSSRLSRSVSEPPSGNKCTVNEVHIKEISRNSSESSVQFFEENGDPVKERERVPTPDTQNSDDFKSSVRKSLDKQMLNPIHTSESYPSDKQLMIHPCCNSYSESMVPVDKPRSKPDFAALIEECIQLGMPKKKQLPGDLEVYSNYSNAASVIRSSTEKRTVSSDTENKTLFDHMAILEKCIRLCMPTTNDEIKSNAEHSGSYFLNCRKESGDIVDSAVSEKSVDMSKVIKKCKEAKLNKLSASISLDKHSDVSAILDDSDSSSIVRNQAQKPSPSSRSVKYDEISKNDLEFLRRQLNIADKHLLQEALAKGISKEQEVFLIELLIMKRVMTESKQSEKQTKNYTFGLNSFPSNLSSSDESEQSKKNKIIPYLEEPLDPVTLSIVKRILQHKFRDREDNDTCPRSLNCSNSELLESVNSGNCNLEIVLEERIRVTLAKNREGVNGSTVNDFSVSSSCRKESLSTQHGISISRRTSDDFQIDQTARDQKNQENNVMELSNSTSRLYENISDDFSKTFAKNGRSSRRDYAALVEECIQLGMPKKKELSEDNLYANVSELPGYSRCHSLPRPETFSKFRKEGNENSTISKAVKSDTKSLLEECIRMGMPKKNDALVTSNSYNVKNNKEIIKGAIIKTDKKPDYKSLLEECIQLGMPKNKEVFSETRASSPKKLTFQAKCTRVQPVIPTSPLVKQIEQCIKDVKKPDTKEDPEEAIYANISTTVGYPRSMQLKSLKSKANEKGSSDEQQDYLALVDECIKLGMPSRKRSESDTMQEQHNTTEISSKKNPNYEALIEECIQLGMPKRKEMSEDSIYVNTVERYFISPTMDFRYTSFPSRRMLRSDSEPGFNRIPMVNVGNTRSVSALPPHHSSMDRALDECVAWSKNKEMGSTKRSVDIIAPTNPSRNNSVGQTKETGSKNVNVASVARNTPEYKHMCFKTLATATDAEDGSKLPGAIRMIEVPDINEVQSVEQEKNGYKYPKFEYPLEWMAKSLHKCNETEEGSEMSFAELADVDAKLLDPAAMLTALDKYTAELIGQAELRMKLQNKKL